jgi:hypothetical protein
MIHRETQIDLQAHLAGLLELSGKSTSAGTESQCLAPAWEIAVALLLSVLNGSTFNVRK